MPSDSRAQIIDRYLETLRKHCTSVPSAEADEFVGEIRSHIMDRMSAEDNPTPETLEAILNRVGDPRELAAPWWLRQRYGGQRGLCLHGRFFAASFALL